MRLFALIVVAFAGCGGGSSHPRDARELDSTTVDGAGRDAPLALPELVASGLPTVVVVDATHVYWNTQTGMTGSIMMCPMTGACVPTPLVSGLSGRPNGMALDANAIYWTEGNAGVVSTCALAGCNNTPTVIAPNTSGTSSPVGIVVDQVDVFWTDDNSDMAVRSCPKAGCPATGPQLLAMNQLVPGWMASDAATVYWVNQNQPNGAVMACAKAGCSQTPISIASSRKLPYALAVQGSTVYWTEAQQVMRCALAGCGTPELVAGSGTTPSGIAVDTTGVYWVDNGLGTVATCPLAGCPGGTPIVLASGQSGPSSIALDPTYIYWTNETSGDVMRLHR